MGGSNRAPLGDLRTEGRHHVLAARRGSKAQGSPQFAHEMPDSLLGLQTPTPDMFPPLVWFLP